MKIDVRKIFTQPYEKFMTEDIRANQLEFIEAHKIIRSASCGYANILLSQFKRIDHMEVLNCEDGTKIVVGSFYGNIESDGMSYAATVADVQPCKQLYNKMCTSMFFRIKGKPKNRVFEALLPCKMTNVEQKHDNA